MQIQKLGSYNAQTEQGNTYKKTNSWKTGLFLSSALVDTLALAAPKNPIAKEFLTTTNLKDLKIKFNPKYAKAINVVGAIVDIAAFTGIGAAIDRHINKSRALKADKNIN